MFYFYIHILKKRKRTIKIDSLNTVQRKLTTKYLPFIRPLNDFIKHVIQLADQIKINKLNQKHVTAAISGSKHVIKFNLKIKIKVKGKKLEGKSVKNTHCTHYRIFKISSTPNFILTLFAFLFIFKNHYLSTLHIEQSQSSVQPLVIINLINYLILLFHRSLFCSLSNLCE